eukprot:7353718-Lingulodinium_polyedra.AAC.1
MRTVLETVTRQAEPMKAAVYRTANAKVNFRKDAKDIANRIGENDMDFKKRSGAACQALESRMTVIGLG